MKPDWYPHDDWSDLSDEMQERAQAWHAKPPGVRRLIARIEAGASPSCARDDLEDVELSEEMPEESAGLHQAEQIVELATEAEQVIDPPAGTPPPRPKLMATAKWPNLVFDYLAATPEWVTVAEMMERYNARHSAVHRGLQILERRGVLVQGPLVDGPNGRSVTTYQLARA